MLSKDIEVSGAIASYERYGASGKITRCYFCSKCGTRLYHQSTGSPDIVTAKGGIFDDSEHLNPQAHLWISSRLNWVTIPANVEAHNTQPTNLSDWRRAKLTGSEGRRDQK
jgi:hypothetical protein